MKYSIVALASLAALAAAQDSSALPDCSVSCINDSISKNTDCQAGDYACACNSVDAISNDSELATCLITACPDNLDDVTQAITDICAGAASSSVSSELAGLTSTSPLVASTTFTLTTTTTSANATITTSSTRTLTSPFSTTTTTTTTSSPEESNSPGNGRPGNGDDDVPDAAPAVGSIGGLAMFVLALLAL